MSYKHITPDQRNELSALKRTRIKQKEIARLLEKDRTTIYREVIRNKNKNEKYDAGSAKQKTKERRIKANQRFRKIENNKWLKAYIIKKIKKCWSPEQIAGRVKKKWPKDRSKHIGKDNVYEFIYNERKDLLKNVALWNRIQGPLLAMFFIFPSIRSRKILYLSDVSADPPRSFFQPILLPDFPDQSA